ncbi:MAG: type VI secretion system membrane subunit TssM [Psychromonas sp.]|nr:type VI secretion system membrane subunit TssM [Psychromonas sp.]
MKHIIAFFTNRVVISLIGLIILSLLVWFIGPGIKFGEANNAILAPESARLITILIISLLWGMNFLRIKLQEKNNNNNLVNDLQQVDNSAGDIISDQTSEEMLQMGERFTQALTTLKKLNFNGKGSKAALYELPWYIVIGPPGSGKTTALVNSSLDFPLADEFGKGALQGVGGTRNCDWWFTNNAVLIDTAGRYTTQDSHKVIDSSAWEGFLNLLKKHRRRRPINGAIVAISLQDLLTQTEEQRAQHAKTIRLRIDELMEKLEVRFPVYLMFTKSDLVSGFTEFFEDLGKEEREQVLGISLPDGQQASQAPDFAKISTEYKNIVKRLYERVLPRVQSERDIKRRSAIQGFPQQMESLQTTIDSFVQQTFTQNRFKLQPYLRGVYFTSGTQDGTPIDRLMASVSANFGFTSNNMSNTLQQGKSFFLGKMFNDVIFPESELVGTNPFYEKLLKWGQRIAYTSMIGVSVTLIAFWTGAFSQHESNMQEVQNYVTEYQEVVEKESKYSSDIRTTLPALNALAKASIVYDQEQQPWIKSLGMYDNSVNEAADEAYLNQLRLVFYPKLIKYIETHLKSNNIDENLYNAFRTYVMFNKLEHMDLNLVHEWFIEKWEEDFADQGEQKQELLAHLSAFLAIEIQPAELNKQVLASTRQRLLRMPIEQRIYQRIKSQPEFARKVNMLDEMGGAVRDTYIITPAMQHAVTIPVLYTKLSYDQVDFSEDSELIVKIANEKWLLHDESKNKVSFVSDDLKSISKKVKKLYLTDYNKQWQQIYNAMNVKPVSSLMQTSNVLTSFADPIYSPIVAILNVTVTNTELSSQVVDDIADSSKGKIGKVAKFAASKVKWTSVDKKYRDINLLMRESKKQPPPINTALRKIAQVQEMVNSISLAPDPSQKAFELVHARYQGGAENAITALSSYAKNTPKPIKRWLTKLADETWKTVLRSAHQHINDEWRNMVYQPYLESIAGRYPVAKNADNDIALFDFVEFFKPSGNVDTFYLGYIKPFITTRGGWKNKSVDKHNS